MNLQGKKFLIAHSGANDLEMVKAIAREIDNDFQVQPEVMCYSSYPNSTTINQSIDDYMCDVLIVLNLSNLYASSGTEFLRNIWADIILNTQYQAVPSTIIVYGNDKEELRKQDSRFDISKTDGIGFVMLGDDLVAKIQSTMNVQPTIDDIKSCLLKSCETNRKQLEHDLRNYDGPYSLLVGAYYAGEFEGRSGLNDALVKLHERKMHEELKICHAASYVDIFQSLEEEGHSLQLRLCDKLAGRKILLIDDEYETAGWEIALKAIFGHSVDLDAYKGKNWNKSRDLVDEITKLYSLTESSTMMPYDLILMDLYLSDQDKAKKKDDSFTEFASKKIIDKIRKIKKDDIPIILFTASRHAEKVDAVKEIGLRIKYFPKKATLSKIDSRTYFNKFRAQLSEALDWRNIASRKILKIIKKYEYSRIQSQREIVMPLIRAYEKLFHNNDAGSALVELGNILEDYYGPQRRFLNNYSDTSHDNDVNKFSAFICYQIRSLAKHPGHEIIFEDALLFFVTVLRITCGENTSFPYEAEGPLWLLDKNIVTEMVESICKKCTLSAPCSENSWGTCHGRSNDDIIRRSAFLSLERNLRRSNEALSSLKLFLYCYYILKLEGLGIVLNDIEIALIKYSLTKQNKFAPPYNNGWMGAIRNDHIVDSPLGRLYAEMVEIVNDRFELTERFRLG